MFDLMGFLIIIATLMETNWLCKLKLKNEVYFSQIKKCGMQQ